MKEGHVPRLPSTSMVAFSKTDKRTFSKACLPSISSLSSSSSSLSSLLCRRQIPTFERLAKRGKFQEIANVLRDDQIDPPELETWLNKSCVGEETALHRLLRYRPPEALFDLLVHRLSSFHGGSGGVTLSSSFSASSSIDSGDLDGPGESSGWTWSRYYSPNEDALLASTFLFIPQCARDPLGRTPLHIAAAVGCHLSIIHRLLDGATCVFVTDDNGRCPLHWACDNPNGWERVTLPTLPIPKREASTAAIATSRMMMCSASSRRLLSQVSESSSATEATAAADLENMICVIRALLNAYPEAVHIPDRDGMTPLDLAREADACPMVIQMLEETAQLYPKKCWTTRDEEAEDCLTTSHPMQSNVTSTTTMDDDGNDGSSEYDKDCDFSSHSSDRNGQKDDWNNHRTCGAEFASDRISL